MGFFEQRAFTRALYSLILLLVYLQKTSCQMDKYTVEMNCTNSNSQNAREINIEKNVGLLTSGSESVLELYKRRIICYTELITSKESRILFTFREFDLDHGKLGDFLTMDGKVYTNMTKTLGPVVSKSNIVKVSFVTDGGNKRRESQGFRISFKVVAFCGQPNSTKNGFYTYDKKMEDRFRWIENSTATVKCQNEFKVQGRIDTIHCTTDSEWTQPDVQCIASIPPVKANASSNATIVDMPNKYQSEDNGDDSDIGLIVGIVVAFIVIICIVIIILLIVKKRKNERDKNESLSNRTKIEYKVVTQSTNQPAEFDIKNETPQKPHSTNTETLDTDSADVNKYETVERAIERPPSITDSITVENDLYQTHQD